MYYWVLTSLKDFIKFNGRSCRTESRYFLIFNIIIGLTAGLIDMLMGFTIEIIPGIPTLILSEITRGILILPNVSLVIRRLHDINKSGWWQLLILTIIGIILLIVWFATDGEKKNNRFECYNFTDIDIRYSYIC